MTNYNNKTASDYIAEARQIMENQEETTGEFVKELKKELNSSDLPFVFVNSSSLADHYMVHVKVSLDAKKDWNNSIYQNSRYAQFSINMDTMKLELLSKSFKIEQKFRKSKVKDAKTTADKIIKFMGSVGNNA